MEAPRILTSSTSSVPQPQPQPETSQLRTLRTDSKLSPKSQTQRTRVLSTLSRIASVVIRDVVKEDGHRFFVIDVYFVKKSLTRFASMGMESGQGEAKTPSVTKETPRGPADFQIKRRFTQFVNLRHEMYYHAHSGHLYHKQPCAFCASVVEFLNHTPALPRLHKVVFQSNESLCRDLEAFLGLAIQLASQAKNEAGNVLWCEGRAMVPLLVKQFVLGDEGESDASVRSSGRGLSLLSCLVTKRS